MASLHVEFTENFGLANPLFINQGKISLGRFSKIIQSDFAGFGQVDDFSCLNRSKFGVGFGVGLYSYISDTVIGNFSLVGSRVSIGGFEHPTNRLAIGAFQWGQSIHHWTVNENVIGNLSRNAKPSYKTTEIGNDVWIGSNSVIKAGVRLGNGVVVGAGSVVTKDTDGFQIVVGNPARRLRSRFSDEVIEEIQKSKWWDLPFEKISELDFSDVKSALNQIKLLTELNQVE